MISTNVILLLFQTTPPVYNISDIQTPMVIYNGGADWLADPNDVSYITNSLPNIRSHTMFPKWDHFDFVIAKDAPKQVYSQIIELIKKES